MSQPTSNIEQELIIGRLLGYTMPPDQAAEVSRELVGQYGSAAAVIESAPEDIASLCGIPLRSAQLICLLPDLARRCMRERIGPAPMLDSVEKAADYVRTLFIGAHYEQFYMLCLNDSFRLIEHQLVLKGTVSETPFYPRLIVEAALRSKSCAVIFAHNHPGGTKSFSIPDIDSTRQAMEILGNVNVLLLDHLLAAGREVLSLRRRGFFAEDEWLKYASNRPKASAWIDNKRND